MPWSDFLELVAFNTISPIGDERADIQAAVIGAALVNTVRSAAGSDAKPIQVQDLLVFKDEPTSEGEGMYVPESPEDEMDALKAEFQSFRKVKAKPAEPPTSPV